MEAPPPTVSAATGRTPGYDVARALALFGMVVVNFSGMAEADFAYFWPFDLLVTQLEGRSAALFVMLAGVGVSLRSRRARAEGGQALAEERQALLRRALALFLIGLLNHHLWPWDILHVYGLFLTLAAGLIAASGRTLFAVGMLVYLGAIGLRLAWPDGPDLRFWSAAGLPQRMLFSGNYPAFPWFCFLLVGIGLGRLDLRNTGLRRRLLAMSGVLFVLAEVGSRVAQAAAADQPAWMVGWLSTWPRPPGPFYVLAGVAAAVWVIAACVEWSEARRSPRAILALTATGQLALTLYFAHEIAILVPLKHGWLRGQPTEVVGAWSLACCAMGVAVSLWWRRRNRQGPLELILRQISSRSKPAWGGALVEGER